jgi:hypothetical protein
LARRRGNSTLAMVECTGLMAWVRAFSMNLLVSSEGRAAQQVHTTKLRSKCRGPSYEISRYDGVLCEEDVLISRQINCDVDARYSTNTPSHNYDHWRMKKPYLESTFVQDRACDHASSKADVSNVEAISFFTFHRRHSINIPLLHHVKLVICQPVLLRMNGNSLPKVTWCYFPKNKREAALC